MVPNTACEHDWVLMRVQDTGSGRMRLDACVICHAILREWTASC